MRVRAVPWAAEGKLLLHAHRQKKPDASQGFQRKDGPKLNPPRELFYARKSGLENRSDARASQVNFFRRLEGGSVARTGCEIDCKTRCVRRDSAERLGRVRPLEQRVRAPLRGAAGRRDGYLKLSGRV